MTRNRFFSMKTQTSTGMAQTLSARRSGAGTKPGGFGLGAALPSVRAAAKYFTHHAQQLQRALVADPIVDAVGILAGAQHALVAQDRQMLRDIALRRSH